MKTLDDLTINEIELLSQAYHNLVRAGYAAGWDFGDFLDIVLTRGEHKELNPALEANKAYIESFKEAK